MSERSCVIGVDVGGTKIAAGLLRAPEGIAWGERVVPTAPSRGGRAVLDDVLGLCRSLREEAESASLEVEALGLGLCELVDRHGKIASANCIAWQELPVIEELSKVAPAVIEADVRAAALAEALWGSGQGFGSYLYVTVGTGIACCLMVEGKAYLGARGATGTMASMPLRIRCERCGQVDTRSLEETAAGPALSVRFEALTGKRFSSSEVIVAAEKGDLAAIGVVESAAQALGSYAGLLINVLDPEAVVVGGGLGLNTGRFWECFVDGTRKHIWSASQRDLPVLQAATGAAAGWMGAAAYAWRMKPANSRKTGRGKGRVD